MKIHTFELCIKNYNDSFKEQGGWDTEDSKKRSEILLVFPHSIIVSADYEEIHTAKKWCWDNFGEIKISKCEEYFEENPVCPIAIKAHELRKIESIFSIDTVIIDDVSVVDHSHNGRWSILWYGKIDYDYGFWEFFFKKEEDKIKYQNNVEKLITTYPSGLQGRTVNSVDIIESKE
jgi:hypothetical protein